MSKCQVDAEAVENRCNSM